MKSSGKSNIIFLILIPLFFIISIIIVDTFVSFSQNKKFKKITENIIKDVISNDEIYEDDYYNEIKRLYQLNNYKTDNLVVDYNGYSLRIDNEHSYFGIISSLTNKRGEDTIINLFGIDFKVKKSSKVIISVEAKYNYDNELEINYLEE